MDDLGSKLDSGRNGPSGAASGSGIPEPAPPQLVRRKRRGVAILPSLFTLGNCLCGFISLNYAARDTATPTTIFGSHFAMAGYFIFLAMAFDMFDGFVARLTRSSSDFGAELDSLADMVSFGLAPAFLSIQLIGDLMRLPAATEPIARSAYYAALPGPFSDDSWMRLFWVIGAIYVSCTAMRLARFNVLNKHDLLSHMSFKGMPSPGAAAVVAATVIFYEALNAERHRIPFNIPPHIQEHLRQIFPYLLPLVLLMAALLMVSRFSYTHLINRFLRGRKTFQKLVVVLLLVMVVVWQPQVSALIAIYVYALSAPVGWLFRKVTGRVPTPPLAAETKPAPGGRP